MCTAGGATAAVAAPGGGAAAVAAANGLWCSSDLLLPFATTLQNLFALHKDYKYAPTAAPSPPSPSPPSQAVAASLLNKFHA